LAGLKQEISEPVIQEENDHSRDIKGMRADWSTRGFWDSRKIALFNACIFNADANSFKTQSLQAVFEEKKKIKKTKYSKAASERRALFTPILHHVKPSSTKKPSYILKDWPQSFPKNGNPVTLKL